MAVIAKVSIGQFAPGDALSGIDDARIAELIEAGHAIDDGADDKPAKTAAKPKASDKPADKPAGE